MGYVSLPHLISTGVLLKILSGVFVGSKKIPRGTFIGIYAGELLTDKTGDERGM